MQELLVEFDDLDEVYRCYMPYIKNGGLFVRTNKAYEMGESLALRVILPDSLEDDVITGKVVWTTPIGVQSSNPAGVGIGFIDDKTNLREKIESQLGTMLNSGNPTYTI